MKKKTFIALFLFASSAFATENPVKNDGVYLQVATPEQMPIPLPASELKKLEENTNTVDGTAGLSNSPERIKNFLIHFNSIKNAAELQSRNILRHQGNAPEVHKDVAALKLGFTSATFTKGTMLFASPIGTQVNDEWTGLERFFEIEGGGLARLTEYDLGLTNGKFYMLKSAINTQVNGKQAISRIYVDESGQTLEEVVWMMGSRFYTLSFLPQLTRGKGDTKQKRASHIDAVSLANGIN